MTNFTEKQIEAASEAVASALGEAYDCTRVWSAWSYGTMGSDDFSMVAKDSERVHEITMAALGAVGDDPVKVELLELLEEAIDLAWIEGSHCVSFDGTVLFSKGYDFSGLDGTRRSEFLAKYECIVWPGNKWSAYCTFEGSLWFEKFDTEQEAKEACMKLLDKVIPDHPAMKARAAIKKAEGDHD